MYPHTTTIALSYHCMWKVYLLIIVRLEHPTTSWNVLQNLQTKKSWDILIGVIKSREKFLKKRFPSIKHSIFLDPFSTKRNRFIGQKASSQVFPSTPSLSLSYDVSKTCVVFSECPWHAPAPCTLPCFRWMSRRVISTWPAVSRIFFILYNIIKFQLNLI